MLASGRNHEQVADDEGETPLPAEEPADQPVTGVVVRPQTRVVPVARPALVVRARNRLVAVSRSPAAVATAAVGATVLAEALGGVARRMLRGPSAPVEVRGTVVHHVHVVHHHVVHILEERRALPPA